MGKGHGLHADRQEDVFPIHGKLVSSFQTETVLDEKTYTITQSSSKCTPSLKVQVFSTKTGKWVTPTVLGEIPVSSNGHSAVLLNKDRIMVILMGISMDECVWFLEVDTPFVKEHKEVLATEVVAWSKGVAGEHPKPIVIAGPSGVGKGTLIGKLMEEFPSTFGFSVSHTTRLPRENEKNGVHYHFTQRSVMEKEIQDGKFLEFASVHGNLYGTSLAAVEAVTYAGKRCILDIDIQGSRSVRASSLEAIFIFISPPSFEELEKRLRGRGTETEEQLHKRLNNAISEVEQGHSPGLFDHILVNDGLEACYKNLKKILGLEGRTGNIHQNGCETKKNPVCYLTWKLDNEFLITCENNSLFLLDASSLEGGAPRQTRGFRIFPVDTLSDRTNGSYEPFAN